MSEEIEIRDENVDMTEKSVESGSGDSVGDEGVKEVKENVRVDKSGGKDNIIFVGVKPFMNYVTGVVMQFQNKGQNEVIVSARGKFISKAVDVAEVARRTFLKDENIKIKDISVNSEEFENKEGKRIFVSAIEIKMVKG
jgi:DNA-binding protein|tara:strand:- start:49 stop:465 length:417 start_codon:yes stop_codon:yes gene_type:complete